MRQIGGKSVPVLVPVEARDSIRRIHAKLKEAGCGMLKGDIALTALIEYEKKIDRRIKNDKRQESDD